MSLLKSIAFVSLIASAGTACAQSYTLTNLTPPGYLEGFFMGAGGPTAVGFGSFPVDPSDPNTRHVHAYAWNQDTQSLTDLHPEPVGGPIWSASFALGSAGTQQVGYGFTSGPNIGLIWSGTAESFITLDSPGTESTVAYATDGTTQVGSASTTFAPGSSRAWVWQGTAASGMDIHPEGLESSTAQAVRDGAIVGTGEDFDYFRLGLYWPKADSPAQIIRPTGFEEVLLSDLADGWLFGDAAGTPTNGRRHAILFNAEDPETFIDLHPVGADIIHTYAHAVLPANATYPQGIQVGIASVEVDPISGERVEHAAVWFGTAASFIDLHQFVPSQYPHSNATGIDAQGNIYGTAYDLFGNYISVRWSPAGAACPADFNGDSFVDDTDFVTFAAAYEQFTVPPADAAADLTGDGFVDDSDFVIFAAAYENFTCP